MLYDEKSLLELIDKTPTGARKVKIRNSQVHTASPTPATPLPKKTDYNSSKSNKFATPVDRKPSVLGDASVFLNAEAGGFNPNATPFNQRTNSLSVEDSLNPHIPYNVHSASLSIPAVEITIPPNQQLPYKYMHNNINHLSDAIDDRISFMTNILDNHLIETLNIQEFDPEAVFKIISIPGSSQEQFYTAGRIISEIPDGKLSGGIQLETCRNLGGKAVLLSLENIPHFSLFPGQIVAVEATNPTGKLIVASRIFIPPVLPSPVSSIDFIKAHYAEHNPVNIIMAAGPFTMWDDLEYQPLDSLTKIIETECPDVVLLMGPFVDETQQQIQSGKAMEIVPIFEIINKFFKRILTNSRTRLLVMPSIKGLESEWVGFPQPPLFQGLDACESKNIKHQYGLDLMKNVTFLPNPVQVSVNEIVLGISTMDSLMHVGSEEYSTETGDRISRLFKHHLSQRHLYPLYPPHFDASVDCVRVQSGSSNLQVTPDMLIIPSALRPCVRVSEDDANSGGCVCINPGFAVKGKSGGTFAKLCIYPLEVENFEKSDESDGRKRKQNEEVLVKHFVASRSRVDVLRL